MYVDMSDLFNDISVTEKVKFIKDIGIDDYGNQVQEPQKNLSCFCIIGDGADNMFYTSKDSYIQDVKYNLYVPTEFMKANDITSGVIVERANGKRYNIVSTPLIKNYASHTICIIAEVRFDG